MYKYSNFVHKNLLLRSVILRNMQSEAEVITRRAAVWMREMGLLFFYWEFGI